MTTSPAYLFKDTCLPHDPPTCHVFCRSLPPHSCHFVIHCSIVMAALSWIEQSVFLLAFFAQSSFLLTLAAMTVSVTLCCMKKRSKNNRKDSEGKKNFCSELGTSNRIGRNLTGMFSEDATDNKQKNQKEPEISNGPRHPRAPKNRKESVEPLDEMCQTLNNMNNEDAFGAKESGVQRTQPGTGANWGKAPVNPSDPAYMTLANLNNQDAFGAVQREGGGGGRKGPVDPSDPAYMTLANINNQDAFGAVQRLGGGQKQNKAPVAANDPQYMTMANVKNEVFDDKTGKSSTYSTTSTSSPKTTGQHEQISNIQSDPQ